MQRTFSDTSPALHPDNIHLGHLRALQRHVGAVPALRREQPQGAAQAGQWILPTHLGWSGQASDWSIHAALWLAEGESVTWSWPGTEPGPAPGTWGSPSLSPPGSPGGTFCSADSSTPSSCHFIISFQGNCEKIQGNYKILAQVCK